MALLVPPKAFAAATTPAWAAGGMGGAEAGGVVLAAEEATAEAEATAAAAGEAAAGAAAGAEAGAEAAAEAAAKAAAAAAVASARRAASEAGEAGGGAAARPTRTEALEALLEVVRPGDALVATTGYTSRELYALREARGEAHEADFLTVGSMGHALSIAQGVALAQPRRVVWCIDGDGACLI